MNALIYHASHDVRYTEGVPRPSPKQNQVLLRVQHAGICGSDLHEYTHGPETIPTSAHPLTNSTVPCPFGHEFAGTVVSDTSLLSASKAPLSSGTKVVVDPRLYCHECINCKAGYTNGCAKFGSHGISGCCGGFGEYAAVDASMCHVVPPDTDMSLAPLCEPLAVAWHAVNLAGIDSFRGKNVLSLGGGPIGIAVIFVLKLWGAWEEGSKVWVSEPSTRRREQCEALGATAVDPTKADIGKVCMDGTNGKGAEFVFDCAGSGLGMKDGFEALAHRGTYINLALWGSPFTLPFARFLFKEATVKGSMCYTDDEFAATVKAFAEGRVMTRFIGASPLIASQASSMAAKQWLQVVYR